MPESGNFCSDSPKLDSEALWVIQNAYPRIAAMNLRLIKLSRPQEPNEERKERSNAVDTMPPNSGILGIAALFFPHTREIPKTEIISGE